MLNKCNPSPESAASCKLISPASSNSPAFARSLATKATRSTATAMSSATSLQPSKNSRPCAEPRRQNPLHGTAEAYRRDCRRAQAASPAAPLVVERLPTNASNSRVNQLALAKAERARQRIDMIREVAVFAERADIAEGNPAASPSHLGRFRRSRHQRRDHAGRETRFHRPGNAPRSQHHRQQKPTTPPSPAASWKSKERSTG